MLSSMRIISQSPEQTHEIGRTLGREAHEGDLFLLIGELGAGKTCLAQGIGRGLCVSGDILSPTFVLVRSHQGRLMLHHVDLYRTNTLEEALDLGIDEYLSEQGVCMVEWANRALDLFPPQHLQVRLEYGSHGNERVIQFLANGSRYHSLLKKIEG